jgi:copper chaperone CopZ
MGYTHGIKWSDDLIRKGIMKVKEGLQLDRMPTRSECVKYTKSNALSVAITRRDGGWYGLAKELGLGIKDSETTTGKRSEKRIKQIIEDKGYEVKQMSQNYPYDLLVNDCLKIDVKSSHLYRGKDGNFYTFRTGKRYATCDIYILVALDKKDEIVRTYIIPSSIVVSNTQISMGEYSSKHDIYLDRWDLLAQYVDFLSGGLPYGIKTLSK